MRTLFTRFGKVQTCIVNHEKRHAFVKMINRHDAELAKAGMEKMKDDQELQNKARQVRLFTLEIGLTRLSNVLRQNGASALAHEIALITTPESALFPSSA